LDAHARLVLPITLQKQIFTSTWYGEAMFQIW